MVSKNEIVVGNVKCTFNKIEIVNLRMGYEILHVLTDRKYSPDRLPA